MNTLKHDMKKTRVEAIIVSPFVRKARVKSMANMLSSLNLNGAQVSIVTRPPSDYKPTEQDTIIELLEYLKSAGFTVVERASIHQKFIILDGRIVWYGSINFLSFGRSEESIMRFENQEIAAELRNTLS